MAGRVSLAHTVSDALRLAEQMRAAGASPREIHAGLERVLRACWPFRREWHYLCETCGDVGAEVLECPVIACERRQTHGPHSYIRPCVCRAGDRWRAKPRTDDDAVAAAAKVQKSKPLTRVGRLI